MQTSLPSQSPLEVNRMVCIHMVMDLPGFNMARVLMKWKVWTAARAVTHHWYCESVITVVRENTEFLWFCFCAIADSKITTLSWERLHQTAVIVYIHIPCYHFTVAFRKARPFPYLSLAVVTPLTYCFICCQKKKCLNMLKFLLRCCVGTLSEPKSQGCG